MNKPLGPFSFERVMQAVAAVKRRLTQSAAALESAGIPYALTDDNAVAEWVNSVEPAAIRNTPDVTIVAIPALVRTKLGTFRDVDRVNLRDLIDVGLVDQTWPARYPPELATRLQLLLDTPGG